MALESHCFARTLLGKKENIMKHLFKRTVVLLNDFKTIDTLLKKAIDFSTQHHTTLEILYVHEKGLFEIPDYFLSEEKITDEESDKGKIKERIEEHLDALNVKEKMAILVYEEDSVERVLHHAKGQKEILFMTAYHAELSPKLLQKTPHTFWIVKKSILTYKNMVLPFDFSENGRKTLQATQHIFAEHPLTMVHDYRYILDTLTIQVDYLNVLPLLTDEVLEINRRLKKEQQAKFEAYKKEFHVEGDCIEGEGALDKDLIEYISQRDFDLTILYHQNEELFLSPSLILELLKGLETDFFIFNF